MRKAAIQCADGSIGAWRRVGQWTALQVLPRQGATGVRKQNQAKLSKSCRCKRALPPS